METKYGKIKVVILCVIAGAIFIGLAEATHRMQKTQIGLTVLYLLGVILFSHNIFAFCTNRAMRINSFSLENYKRYSVHRIGLFIVSIIATVGFCIALYQQFA
jgi:Na+/H+-translocating membrane pyrophosphatase